MMRVLVLLLLLAALPAAAAERLALVIGNGGYAESPLANPVSDARLISAALSQAGFTVETVTDADRRGMEEAVRSFAERLKRAGSGAAAVFYYAGHGVQVEGRNYLMPLGARLDAAADLPYQAIEAQWALDLIGEAGAGLSILILDACRNNPFPSLSRGASRGLARMDAPRGAILSYSTAPGEVAADGAGANSPYSAALAEAMAVPGLPVEEMFKTVRRAVLRATDGRQTPWESSSLVGDFAFTPGARPGDAVELAMAAPGSALRIAPGSTFRDCPDCPEMAALPAGEGRLGGERLAIRPFAIQRREVTRGDFARFVAETGHRPAEGCWFLFGVWVHDPARNWRAPGYEQADDHPVVCVSWADAAAYADWMSRKSGARYRLPSEAEWAYAAGAPPWGAERAAACGWGNVHDRTADEAFGSGLLHSVMPCADGAAATASAGSFRPGANGLFDMYGNAAEWTEDCWNADHRGRPADGGPRRTGDCVKRVAKGTDFITPAADVKEGWRLDPLAAGPSIYLGFRLARDL